MGGKAPPTSPALAPAAACCRFSECLQAFGQAEPSACKHHSSVSKESACNATDPGSIPGLGRSPGEGNGSPLQYSCLENPMDSSPPGSAIHGIFQARILEWAAIFLSRGSSQSRDRTQVSSLQKDAFTVRATSEAQEQYAYVLHWTLGNRLPFYTQESPQLMKRARKASSSLLCTHCPGHGTCSGHIL